MKQFMYACSVLLLALVWSPQAAGQFDWGAALNDTVKGVSNVVEKTGAIKKTKDLTRAMAGAKEKKSAPVGNMSKVAAALENAGYFTKTKAKPNARYYIFICSASWCPPCRKLMPQIVREYKKNIRKNDSVSLILLGSDRSEEACQEYLKHYKTDMPGVEERKNIDLPNRPRLPYIPFAFIMDAEGNVIVSGHGSLVLDWKKQIANKNKKK